MKKADFDDLKQFILSVVSQSEARLGNRIDGVENSLSSRIDGLENRFDIFENRFDALEQKMDDGFAGVGEAIENLTDLFESRYKNHEKRILKLEHKTA